MQVPPILQAPPVLFQESAFSSYKTGKSSTKKFKCPHVGCDRSFAKSDHLRTHVRTHTGERPFRCTHEECHKEFSDLANLKRHMRVHTGERPFTCPETGCGKQFSVSSNLKQHMRVHTGERPYSCPICGKAFGHVSSRRKHMNIHEGSTFKSLLDKRSTADQRKMNPQSAVNVARWRSNHLVRRDQVQPFIRRMVRRPSSRGSESSYESTSPTGYPAMPLPGRSPGTLPAPNSAGIYQMSPGLDPLAAAAAAAAPYPTHFTFRQEHHRMFLERQPVYRQTEKPTRLQLRKEVSRPKPCYPGEQGPAKENTNTLNMMGQERPVDLRQERPVNLRQLSPPNRAPLHASPISKILSPEPMLTEEAGKRNQALKDLTKESAIAAGRIAIARCAGFNNVMELGRYVTVAMDTSYKIASLAIFLHHNACRIKPRQVPVRTIQ